MDDINKTVEVLGLRLDHDPSLSFENMNAVRWDGATLWPDIGVSPPATLSPHAAEIAERLLDPQTDKNFHLFPKTMEYAKPEPRLFPPGYRATLDVSPASSKAYADDIKKLAAVNG